MLISTIEDFVKFAPISRDLSIITITPSIRKAERRFILPLIGQALYDTLQDGYDNSSLDTDQKKLLEFLQTAVASLSLWNFVKIGGVNIDNAGIFKMKTEGRWNLGDSEQKTLESTYLSDGLDALDDLMNFLEANLSKFGAYGSTEEYKAERSSLVPSAKVLQSVFPLFHPRVTFRAMREAIGYVEKGRVKKAMQDYYVNLLAKPESELDADDQDLRDYARKAIIYFAASRALLTRTVEFTNEGLKVIVGVTQTTPSENSRIEAAAKEFDKSGEAELGSLMDLLKEKQPTGYVAPAIISPIPDTDPKGIYLV